MGAQIKREVNIMKQIKDKNPHAVQLYEVLASKTKIYLVSETCRKSIIVSCAICTKRAN